MRGAPLEEELAPVISRGFNKTNMETLQKVRKAWEVVQKKDEELRGNNNGPIGGYRKWLKAHVQGLDWLPSLRTAKREEVEASEEDAEVQALRAELEQAQTIKERFKSAALKIRKENSELRDVNIATTKALRQKGLVGKNTAGTNSEGLCGAATTSLSSGERKWTNHE